MKTLLALCRRVLALPVLLLLVFLVFPVGAIALVGVAGAGLLDQINSLSNAVAWWAIR